MDQKNLLIILITIILTAAVFGGGVYFWQSSTSKAERLVLQGQIDQLERQIEVLREKGDETEDETSVWQMYNNNQLGFAFKYPSDFSKVVFTERESGDGSGKLFTGLAKSGKWHLEFGGNTKDFSEGREGFITDFRGYLKEGDKYYHYYSDLKEPSDKQYYEIVPDKIEIVDGKEVLIFENREFKYGLPEDEVWFYYNQAYINIDHQDYLGLTITMTSLIDDKKKISSEALEVFGQILSTFKFIDSSVSGEPALYNKLKDMCDWATNDRVLSMMIDKCSDGTEPSHNREFFEMHCGPLNPDVAPKIEDIRNVLYNDGWSKCGEKEPQPPISETYIKGDMLLQLYANLSMGTGYSYSMQFQY